MTSKRAKEGKVFCGMVECASRRGVEMCAKCHDYPCRRFDEASEDDCALFSEPFISYIRDNSK